MSADRLIPVIISEALKQAGRWREHGGLRVVNNLTLIQLVSCPSLFIVLGQWAVLEISERFKGASALGFRDQKQGPRGPVKTSN